MTQRVFVVIFLVLLSACEFGATPTRPAPKVTPLGENAPTKHARMAPTLTPTLTPTLEPTPPKTPTVTPQPTNTVEPTVEPTRAVSPTPRIGPLFINHSPPPYTVDFSVFEQSDCPVAENGARYCDPNNSLGSLGCDEIQKPPDLLGALKPAFPIALCFVLPHRRADRQAPPQGSYLYRQGGMLARYARYVIRRADQFQVLQSAQDFQNLFAPIESPDEALGYAIAVTGLDAVYGLKYEPGYVYSADTLEDTFARTDGDGYLVHLYHFAIFGCGPHELAAFDLHVSRDGAIQELAQQAVYRDPRMDNVCTD